MTQVSRGDERRHTALVPAQPVAGPIDTPRAGVEPARSHRRRHAPPRPRRAPGPEAMRREPTPLPALGGDFLSAALALLCRDEPLSRAEIGDHADVVAEVADALAAVADRLAQDLDAGGPDALGPEGAGAAAAELVRARDALHTGSVQTRRGAAVLWARHIASLRAQVEQADAEPASVTGG